MSEINWLLFIAQLPATPSSLRVNVWRKLRDAGAVSLQNGVWLLPRTAEHSVFLERLLASIRNESASGQIFAVQGLDQATQDDITGRISAERGREYAEFLEQCAQFEAEIEKESQRQKFTFAELEENEQNLQRLRKWILKIQRRDFFKNHKTQEAVLALRGCQQKLHEYTRLVFVQEGIEIPPGAELFPEDDASSNPEEDHDRA